MVWKVEGEVAALTISERPPASPGDRSGAKTCRGKSAVGGGGCGGGRGSGYVRSALRAEPGEASAWPPWGVGVRAS